jgi:hypothetical protein
MSLSINRAEVDKNFTPQAKERHSVSYLQGLEIPPAAIIMDSQLIRQARGQISLGHSSKQTVSLEKIQFTLDRSLKWSNAQNERQNRTLRDLQFELASNSIINLRAATSTLFERVEQTHEITAFESRLPKNEFGGCDEATQLGISYENGKTFLDRIESDARDKCHFDSETSKFVSKLKSRVRDKRNVSLDKERRRKKAIANQTTSPAYSEHSVHNVKAENDQVADDDSSVDDVRNDADHVEDERKATADKSMRIFAEQIRMQHAKGDHLEKYTNVLHAQSQRSADKKIRNYEFCREIVRDLVSNIECYKCPISENQVMKNPSEAPEELLDYIDEKLGLANSGDPSLPIKRFGEKSFNGCTVPFYLLSSNTGRWDFISNITREGQNMEAGVIDSGNVAPLMEKIPRYLESSHSILEALLEISCADASDNISLALDLKEQHNLNKDTVIMILCGGPSASVASADMLRTVRWMGGSATVEVWDVAAAVEVGRALAHLLEGKTNKITVPTLIDIFLRGSVFAETSLDESQAFDGLVSITIEPNAMKVATEIADAATRILTSNHQIAPSVNAFAKVDLKVKSLAPDLLLTDTTFGILLGQVLWLRNHVRSLYMDHIAAPATLESLETFKLPSPKSHMFAPTVLACSCIYTVTACAQRDSASFALVVDWFLRGGSRDSLHDSVADSAWKKLLKDAAAAEGDVITLGNKNRKEKGLSKVKNGLSDVEVKGHSAITCMLRVVKAVDVQLDSADFSDLGLEANPALRHESTRLIISSYYSAGRESKSDRDAVEEDAQERLIQQYAASLSTPYFQILLSGHASKCLPTACHEANDFSLVCSAGLSVSETLLAVALTCAEPNRAMAPQAISIVSATLDPTIESLRTRSDIVACIVERRKRLTEAEQLWLRHISGTNPIDFIAVQDALNLISDSTKFETEMTGTVLMVFSHYISLFEKDFLCRERVMRSSVKTSDPRFEIVCSQLLEHLSSINTDSSNQSPTAKLESCRLDDDSSLLLNDCVCLLGDIIDDRHMTWISLAAVQRDALEHHMQTFTILTSRISSQLAAVMISAHALKAQSAAAVPGALQDTCGSWATPHSGSQAPRWVMEMRRDRLRLKSLLLADMCSSLGRYSGSAVSDEEMECREAKRSECMDVAGPWSDVIFLDQSISCDADMSLKDDVQNELSAELFERAASLLSGLIVVLNSLQSQLNNHHETMQKVIVDRYRYEHSLLAKWAATFRASVVTPHGCFTIPNPVFHFDFADIADTCNASSRTDAMIELGDLVLSPYSLQELSKLMHRDAVIMVEILTEESCHALLLKAVYAMDVEQMCSAWRVARLTELLVREVFHSSCGGEVPCSCMTGGVFVKSIVMTILLASVPEPPQQDFILRLGTLLRGKRGKQEGEFLSFSLQNRPSTASFRKIVHTDATLLTIWCSKVALCENTPQAVNDMVDTLLAVAACCLDADGRVIEDQVLLLLCYSPPSIRTRSFERALLMRGDVGSDVSHLPPMLMEGLCKALAVASKIDGVCTRSVSGGIESKIGSAQYQMLLYNTSCGLPAVTHHSQDSVTDLAHLASNGHEDYKKEMNEVTSAIEVSLLQKCLPLADNSVQTETAVTSRVPRRSVTTDVQVAQNVLDAIMKSGRSTTPFSAPIIR